MSDALHSSPTLPELTESGRHLVIVEEHFVASVQALDAGVQDAGTSYAVSRDFGDTDSASGRVPLHVAGDESASLMHSLSSSVVTHSPSSDAPVSAASVPTELDASISALLLPTDVKVVANERPPLLQQTQPAIQKSSVPTAEANISSVDSWMRWLGVTSLFVAGIAVLWTMVFN